MLVTIDLDAYDQLPPRQLRAMLRALRFADGDGVVRANLNQLAMPGLSRSAVHRDLAELERAGGYYLIPARFANKRIINSPKADELSASGIDPVCAERVPTAGTYVPTAGTYVVPSVPEAGTTNSRARPFKVLSSVSKETSERELSLETIQENLADGWREAAAAERRRASLPAVDLDAEWRKYVRHFDGQVRLGRWLNWAARAYLDRTNTPTASAGRDNPPIPPPNSPIPKISPTIGDEREQRRARDWVKRGFWLRDGSWGPTPDQPGCTLPPALVAWCRENARC